MSQSIANIALIVKDYDEAIQFYTQKLKFDLIEDTPLTDQKRWVIIAPHDSHGANLLLAKADSSEQENRIGNQTGGRVFLFLRTNDFWKDYQYMKSQGVLFHEEPRSEIYGMVVVFSDLYGNKWDLLESKQKDLTGE